MRPDKLERRDSGDRSKYQILAKSIRGNLRRVVFSRTQHGFGTHTSRQARTAAAHCPAIKKMVRFAQLNLMDDAYPLLVNWTSGCDVIFCRNVLMYLTPQGMRKVIRQLYRSLATDDG